jgi:hypothetical protein
LIISVTGILAFAWFKLFCNLAKLACRVC